MRMTDEGDEGSGLQAVSPEPWTSSWTYPTHMRNISTGTVCETIPPTGIYLIPA